MIAYAVQAARAGLWSAVAAFARSATSAADAVLAAEVAELAWVGIWGVHLAWEGSSPLQYNVHDGQYPQPDAAEIHAYVHAANARGAILRMYVQHLAEGSNKLLSISAHDPFIGAAAHGRLQQRASRMRRVSRWGE